MIEHVNKLFAIIIVLSLLTYFERADYNLPLFVFAGLLWNHQHPPQKTRVWYLMTFSLIVDLVWIIYWAAIWGGIQDRQSGLCNFTLIVSSVIFVLKIITVIILFLKEDQCNKAILELPQNIKSIFTGPSVNQDYNL